MAEEKSKARLMVSDREGVLSNWVTQSSELAEKLVAANFGVIREIRGEAHQLVSGTIDWVESSQQRFFKVARGLHDRVGKLGEEAINAAESVTLSWVHVFRETGHGVTEAASRASSSLVKSHDEKIARAA